MKIETKEKIKDIAIRTLKTFLEAFIGALPVTITYAELTNEAFIQATLISALSAGVCAVLNLLLALLKK